MSEQFTPLEVAERIIGDLGRLAVICGIDAKAPYHWRRGSSSRAAGYMPIRRTRQLWLHCKTRGLPLRPEWLLEGATAEEIEAEAAVAVAAQ